jgi:hypothetical protein
MATKPMSDDKLVERVKEFWNQGRTDNQDWRRRAVQGRQFYLGKQWASADIAKLKAEGRPYLTINRILPAINALSGAQRQNRQDLRVFPRSGATVQAADVLTALVKHALDTTNAQWELSEMFVHGCISGKGWLAFGVDYSEDRTHGDLTIRAIDPLSVVEDRDANEYDINASAKFVIREYWQDRDELDLLYPDKTDDFIKGALDPADPYNAEDVAPPQNEDEEDYGDQDSSPVRKFRYRVRECWWRDYRRVVLAVDLASGNVIELEAREAKRARDIAKGMADRLRIIERVEPVMHVTTTIGHVVLDHVDNPLNGLPCFPFVRFTPYHVADNLMGVVDNLIGPQQEHNKRRSQALHHLNKTAHSGWIADDDALTPTGKLDLQDFGSKPGTVIYKRPGSLVEPIRPVEISAGHLTLDQLSSQDIRDVSGVNSDLQGQRSERAESGRAMLLRHRQGMLVNEIVFDNFSYSLQLVGDLLVKLITMGADDRKSYIYSDEEIAAICGKESINVDLAQLRTFSMGRYGVQVSEAANLPTSRMANYEMLLETVKIGIPINPIHIIEASDLPNKDAIIADLQAQQQAAAQAQAPMAGGMPGGSGDVNGPGSGNPLGPIGPEE